MTDGEALLRAIYENAADDTPRLVYADFLDENGDPDRAEFIRGQVRLAGMNPWDDGYVSLDIRCRQLARAHPEWLDGLDAFVSRSERMCGQRDRPFERGFPARVRLTPEQFVENHDRLFTRTAVREVEFDADGRTGTGFHALPGVPELGGAEFVCVKGATQAKEMVACLSRLGRLDHFGLAGSALSHPVVTRALTAQAVAGAKSVRVVGTPFSPLSEERFAAAVWPNLARLVRTSVTHLDWLRAPFVGHLRELAVSDSDRNSDAGQKGLLADVLPTTDVHTLSLGYWLLDAAGGRALGRAVAKSRVRSFALAQTSTPSDVARALLTAESLAGLRALFLGWAELDAEVLGRLTGTGLRVCALDHVTSDALSAFTARTSTMPELVELRLGLVRTREDDPFHVRLRDMLEAGTFPRLTSLTLCDTTPYGPERPAGEDSVGDRIAKAIARCPAAAGLTELQLGSNVTRIGAKALSASPYLSGLRLLDVRVWPKSPTGERALTERFGARVFLGIQSREF